MPPHMQHCNGIGKALRAAFSIPSTSCRTSKRPIHVDNRNRLSSCWTPTLPFKKGDEPLDGVELLYRAAFVRQAHSGIFHLLPLGLRVLEKVERLIDKHLAKLGASKVSLSSLSSEKLWWKSGRMDKGRGSEFFHLRDRKGKKYLLSPTHEEEITSLIAGTVRSYQDLPLRLYQVTRKYRDEARPRQGLLRGREFIMKDLYTFDATEDEAKQTYEEVRAAYRAILDEISLPYLVASADSGNMGGNLSHEYHFASEQGEDTIIACESCDYSVNEELYIGKFYVSMYKAEARTAAISYEEWLGISKDRQTFVHAFYPAGQSVNIYAVRALFPELDASVEDPLQAWKNAQEPITDNEAQNKRLPPTKTVVIYDPRLRPFTVSGESTIITSKHFEHQVTATILSPTLDNNHIILTKAQPGDRCPHAHAHSPTSPGKLHMTKAVEIGHTFHLHTRYSIPFSANVITAQDKPVPISMGCHGIGVSRLIGATANLLADDRGLNWPLSIAPFSAVIVFTNDRPGHAEAAASVYDLLVKGSNEGGPPVLQDAVIDDRKRQVGWKMFDADLIGFPFIVVVGRAWDADVPVVEVQCRRLGVKEDVEVGRLRDAIGGWAAKL